MQDRGCLRKQKLPYKAVGNKTVDAFAGKNRSTQHIRRLILLLQLATNLCRRSSKRPKRLAEMH
jgi:predicted NACHT family NTPase